MGGSGPAGGADPNGLSLGHVRCRLLHFSAVARQQMLQLGENFA